MSRNTRKVGPYKHYSVKCIKNDKIKESIRFLEFEFHIDAREDVEETKKWIEEELDRNGITCDSITVSKGGAIGTLCPKELILTYISHARVECMAEWRNI